MSGSKNWNLEAGLWRKLKRHKTIAREQFSFKIQGLSMCGSQNQDLEAPLRSKLKQFKIMAREQFSFEIKVWACLGARIWIWKLGSGAN